MSRRCLICGDINPCRLHAADVQDTELERNCREIRHLQTNPPSAHLEQQAREVLAKLRATKIERRIRYGFGGAIAFTDDEETREAPINPDGEEAAKLIEALLASRDAPKPAPEHHELRKKVAERYGFSGVRETHGRISFVAIVDHHDNDARIAFVPFSNRHPPLRQPDVDLIVRALNAYNLPNLSPGISELVDGIDHYCLKKEL